LSEKLIQEGFAREFVNKVQNMRKESDLEVMDRILIHHQSSAKLNKALYDFSDFICKETLANQIIHQENLDGIEWDLNGELCRIKIEVNF